MNKKYLIAFLILVLQCPAFANTYIDRQLKETQKNVKYNSISKHTTKYQLLQSPSLNIKDPKLITVSTVKQINEKDYKTKLAKDELIYNSTVIPLIHKNLSSINVQPSNADFYNIYRISERIIRANNLEYTNWRIAIRKSEDEVNAASTAANFIWINTALYDSLYNNNDALAFVIAHEMAHHILGHHQRMADLNRKLVRLNKRAKYVNTQLGNSGVHLSAKIQKKRIAAEARNMEYMADSLAEELIMRAGYDLNKSADALNLLNTLPHIKTLDDTHPQPEKRIESFIENSKTFPQEWINEGKSNIIDSEVLQCKKSSDRVSIIINQNPNAQKTYQPETLDQKITRIAYSYYRNCEMEKAIKYFKKLDNLDKNYIAQLYISYAEEYLYTQTKQEKYLKSALNSITKAQEINPTDKYVNEQYNNITNQLLTLQ